MASGSSTTFSEKKDLYDLVMKQYQKDVAMVEIIGTSMKSLKESIKERDGINKQLSLLPKNKIRDLAIEFNMEHCNDDSEIVRSFLL